MAIHQGITQQNTILIMLEHHFLLQDDTPHTIQRGGNLVTIEFLDVLVSHRIVVVSLILVQSKIKLSTMLNHCNIQRAQEHMILIVQFWNWHDKQSVILAGITVYNR